MIDAVLIETRNFTSITAIENFYSHGYSFLYFSSCVATYTKHLLTIFATFRFQSTMRHARCKAILFYLSDLTLLYLNKYF